MPNFTSFAEHATLRQLAREVANDNANVTQALRLAALILAQHDGGMSGRQCAELIADALAIVSPDDENIAQGAEFLAAELAYVAHHWEV